jgi:hypothetical protein
MPRVRLRSISFAEACRISDGKRYTLEHLPAWSSREVSPGRYFAPQFATDREWYDNTVFHGEPSHYGSETSYHSLNYSWPLGMALDKPYRIQKPRVRLYDCGWPDCTGDDTCEMTKVCMCGSGMDAHGIGSGHSPISMHDYYAGGPFRKEELQPPKRKERVRL